MLTEGFDGVLLGVFVLTGLPTGHQGCDGERVGPGRELRFRGRRVLHIGGEPDQNIPLKMKACRNPSEAPPDVPPAEGKPADLSCAPTLKWNLVEVSSDACRTGPTPEAVARPAVGGLTIGCSFGSFSSALIIPATLQSGPPPPRHGPTVPTRLWYRTANERKAQLSHARVCVCLCV